MRWCAVAALVFVACKKDEDTGDSGSDTTDSVDTIDPTDTVDTTDTVPAGPTSRLRVVNASELYGAAFLFACPEGGDGPEDAEIVLPALQATPFRNIAAGDSSLGITYAGEAVDCAEALALTTEEDRPYTMWVSGTHEAPIFGYALDDIADIPPDQARLAFRHTAVGLGALRLFFPGEKVGQQVEYGAVHTATFDAAAFELLVDVDSDDAPDWSFSLPAPVDGTYVPFFFALQGEVLGLMGLRPNGTYAVLAGVAIPDATTL
jgi:hypothetical protein